MKEAGILGGFQCNNLQLALALATVSKAPAYFKSGTKKNQMLVVPAAKGKTRIAMAIAIGMKAKYKDAMDQVIIVYDNKLLEEQDFDNWTNM